MTSFEELAYKARRHVAWVYQRPGHPESIMVTPVPKTHTSASAICALKFGVPMQRLRPGGSER